MLAFSLPWSVTPLLINRSGVSTPTARTQAASTKFSNFVCVGHRFAQSLTTPFTHLRSANDDCVVAATAKRAAHTSQFGLFRFTGGITPQSFSAFRTASHTCSHTRS